MKRKILGLMIGLVAALPIFVNAAEVEKVDTVEKLRSALENGKSVELTKDITIEDASSNVNGRSTGVAIIGSGDITIDGNGYTIDASKVRTTLEIYATGEGANVTLTDVKVNNSYSAGRAVDTRTGNITLTLDGATLTTTGSGNTQVLTIGGNYEGAMEVKILNSTISDGISGYGIVTFNKVNMTIDNSNVSAYGALYLKPADSSKGSDGSIVTVKNKSVLSTDNVHSGLSNAFATLILEDNNLTINIENSKIKAVSTGDQPQYAFIFRKENCKVNVSGESFIEVDTEEEFVEKEDSNIVLNAGVSSNIEIPTKYLAKEEGKEAETDVYEIVIDTETGETKYVVATEEEVENLPYEIEAPVTVEELKEELEALKKELEKVNEEELSGADLKEYQAMKKIVTMLEGKKIVSLHDIYYGSFIDGNYVINSEQSELKEAVKVTLTLPTNLPKVKDGYVRKYSVLRSHMNANQEFEYAELSAVEKDGKVTFETDKFSTYILTYEDVKDTKNPNTFDGISLYMIIASVSLVGLVSLVLFAKKAKNY